MTLCVFLKIDILKKIDILYTYQIYIHDKSVYIGCLILTSHWVIFLYILYVHLNFPIFL